MREMNRLANRRTLAAAAIATLSVSSFAVAGTTPDAVTISLSGSTAMRAFTTNAQFTALTPGNTMTLNNGFSYTAVGATPTIFPAVQLGANTNDTYPVANPLTNANYRALRVEWHEQGSVEGILELANDQIGYTPGNQIVTVSRNPSVGNPTWVNGSIGGTLTAPGTNAGGYTINASGYDTYTDFNLAGVSNLGGQNRVQMAISDVTARQGFSTAGANGAWNKTPGQAGYGKGNPALAAAGNTSGVGIAGARQQFVDATVLNMSTDKVDPSTGSNYEAGAWNTAGVDNLVNKKVAITATTFAANPGTGLTKLNRTDAQFLQATGRLANGADFNVVARDANSGTRNVAALNAGLDPSFAAGENDDGNTGSVVGASDPQQSIGDAIRFSGKTAGGNGLRPTVQNSRMAVGHLSISDARGGNALANQSRPLRVLAYRDDANDLADGSNAGLSSGFADPASGEFVKISFDSIADGTYVLYQNQTYVTVRTPGANYGTDDVKGDYSTHDVKQLQGNILNSAGIYPAGVGFLNPANALIANGFIPTQYMKVQKDVDGLNQSVTNPGFNAADFDTVRAQAQAAFVVADANAVTSGSGSTYGNVTAATGGIAITNGNYLFGDFDNDGDRDFADVKLAQAAQDKLLASGAGVDYVTGTGASNAQAVPGLTGALASMNGYDGTAGAKKGDLLVKGDFNSDGRFDGKDLYLLARGAALADSASTDQLTGDFGDSVRNGLLRKNAALDYINASATAQQKLDASANLVNDPTGANAFNKLDVNRDGLVNLNDAVIVDKLVGASVASLDDQLAATIAVDSSINAALQQRLISLVDVELDDNLLISAVLANGASDFKVIRDGLGSALAAGDTNFDGAVDFSDLLKLAQRYGAPGIDRWSDADFDLNGLVNFDDLLSLAQNYGAGSVVGSELSESFASDWALARSLVPEPATLGLLGAIGLIARRRRD